MQAPGSTATDAAGAAGARLAVKFQQKMMEAVKEQRWEDALDAARQAHSLDQKHPLVIQFIQVLEEKINLDNPSSSDDEDDEEEVGGPDAVAKQLEGQALEDEESSSDESSTDSSDDDDDDDDDLEGDAADAGEGNGNALSDVTEPSEVDAIRATHAALRMSHAERNAMRGRLRSDIAKLKEKEATAQLVSDDPLLGA